MRMTLDKVIIRAGHWNDLTTKIQVVPITLTTALSRHITTTG